MAKTMVVKVPSARTRILALRPGKGMQVVAHGRSLARVMQRAKKAGVKEPAIVFVPNPNERHIY